MFSIEITSQIESWFQQPDVWNSLSRGVPFRETSWLGSWWKHLGQDLEAYLVIARDTDGNVCGLLPLYRDASGTRGRTLRFIGDGNACTDDASILATEQHAVNVAEAIGRHLSSVSSHSEYGWDVLDLDGIVEGDEACCALARGLQSGGSILHSHSRMNTWFKPCVGPWDDHLKRLSKSHRRHLVSQMKALASSTDLKYVESSGDDVEPALARLIELHQQRWIAAGQPGTYALPEFRDFIQDAVRSFSDRGMLYLPTLRQDSRMISGELHFVGGNGRSYCYSTGYDIELAEIEPGRILNVQVLKHTSEEEWEGIDLMRGNEPYKERMGATPRKLLRVRAVAPSFVPRLYHAAWRTQFEVKQWMRRRAGRKLIDVVDLAAAE